MSSATHTGNPAETSTAFLELAYRNPSFPQLGIESFRISELRRRMPAGFFRRVQRPRFHLLALYLDGQGSEEIDFVSIACQPGTLLHVHPGQVLRYLSVEAAEASLILFTPEFLPPGLAAEAEPAPMSHLNLDQADFNLILHAFEAIEREYTSTNGDKFSAAILRHLLSALLLQLGRITQQQNPLPVEQSHQQALLQHFLRELEQRFMLSRTIQDYAGLLGCSARTLNRASQQLTGKSAKQLLDQRITLEAKRLLAHTTLSVAEIAEALNFSEATNFLKFFRRNSTELPGEFRLRANSQNQS